MMLFVQQEEERLCHLNKFTESQSQSNPPHIPTLVGISKAYILISKGPGTCSPQERSQRGHKQDEGPMMESVLSSIL